MRNLLLFFILVLSSCSEPDEIREQILPKKEFVSLLIDLELTEANTSFLIVEDEIGRDQTYMAFKAVFEKHQVSQEEFRRSMAFYAARRELIYAIYEEVMDSVMAITRSN